MAEREMQGGEHGSEHQAEATLTIRHPGGLHLRTAATFVRTAARFASSVRITNLSRENALAVNAKSMLGLLQSGVSAGHQIYLRAEGADASDAVAELRALVERDFEEP